MKSHLRAFTLVELLVVIAIIGLLAALTVGGMQRSLEQARVTQCLANLRAIGAAATLFSAENDGRLPQSSHQGPALSWRTVLPPYFKGGDARKILVSPLAPNPRQAFSYAINDFLTAHPYGAEELNYSRQQSVGSPARTLFFTLMTAEYGPTDHFHFADAGEAGYAPGAFSAQVQTDVVAGRGHYLFVDGHVELIAWETLKDQLTAPGSRFVDPTGHQD